MRRRAAEITKMSSPPAVTLPKEAAIWRKQQQVSGPAGEMPANVDDEMLSTHAILAPESDEIVII